ncbi:hypothetical protein QFC19_001276 [Naganishia cerealis]|uniref:Uncharacterized protein n=1 Tax=Naganishia cerealis TaxID=610337 RepID=A0ACC2WI40_9TREE|nr:hypothetical protein QFC19_001276 [Naganishia cerealis]
MHSSPRHHIVFVPGFGGFDAIGQIRYYTGVSKAFHDWQNSRTNPQQRPPVVIHYFDNLPTASVATRAERLCDFLAKRVARGEFRVSPGSSEDDLKNDDKVFLVGHSTGGLDIRKLLSDLQDRIDKQKTIPTDGNEFEVKPYDILRIVDGIVFLSVPQWGTNIANWVISKQPERQFIAHVAATVALKASENIHWPLIDRLYELSKDMDRRSREFRTAVWTNTATDGSSMASSVIAASAKGVYSIVHGGVSTANGVTDLGVRMANGAASVLGTTVTSIASAFGPSAKSAVGEIAGSAQRVVETTAGFIADVTRRVGGKVEDAVGPPSSNLPQHIWNFNNAKLAIEDSIRESSQSLATTAIAKVNAREAASELQFYLDNINDDFGAINDLSNYWRLDEGHSPTTGRQGNSLPASPAHFSLSKRDAEIASWKKHKIRYLSYATLGNRPPPFNRADKESGGKVDEPVWSGLPISGDYDIRARNGCDSTYLAAWSATAGGKFNGNNVGAQTVTDLESGNPEPVNLEQWDNDGIVNTASMLWPNGKDTVLVHGDHGDIIGHYELVPTVAYTEFQQLSDRAKESLPAPARRYASYDIFVSGSGFTPDRFTKVWNGVFDFCG